MELGTLISTLPRIYPITDVGISGLSHSEQVEKLIAGGAGFIQLRDKQSSSREFFTEAERAILAARQHGVRVVINDRVDIALTLRSDGVHLGQDDLPPEKAREILGERAIIGLSTHSSEQVRAALKLPIDYIAFGPIFPTRSKKRADDLVGLAGLSHVRDIAGHMPLVAIGGINAENLSSVFAAGADSAAIIGAIISDAASIEARMRDFEALAGSK